MKNLSEERYFRGHHQSIWENQDQLTSLLLLLSHFSRVQLCATPWTAAHQAPCPWDSPGKNTGVGCHFRLQCMKVKSESEVAQSCLTLSDPMDYSLPGSSIHGIFQARVLEWGAIAFSKLTSLKNKKREKLYNHPKTMIGNKNQEHEGSLNLEEDWLKKWEVTWHVLLSAISCENGPGWFKE